VIILYILVGLFVFEIVFGLIFTVCMRKFGTYGSGTWF